VVRVDITGFSSGTRLQNSWEPVFRTSQIRSYTGLTQTHGPLSKNAKILNHIASLLWCYLIHGNKTRKNKHWSNPSVPSVFAISMQKREPSWCRGREM